MDTTDVEETINAWGRTLNKVGKWGIAVALVVGSVVAWWSVTSEEEARLRSPRPGYDSDDDDDDTGGDVGTTNKAKTPRATTPRVQTVDAQAVVETPGADDEPVPEPEPEEYPLGRWVAEMMALKEGEYGPDTSNQEAMVEQQLMMMMNELESLQQVLTGKRKKDLLELTAAAQQPEIQGTPQQMQLMQMLQQFAAEASAELNPEEQQQRQAVFFQLQLQGSQLRLQEALLEAQKSLIFAALPAHKQGERARLDALKANVQKECSALEAAGNNAAAAEKGTQFSVDMYNALHELEVSIEPEARAKLRKDKSQSNYTENLKFARYQLAVELETLKQQKGMEFVQKDAPNSAEEQGGKFFQWFLEQQMLVGSEQDPQQKQLLVMQLPGKIDEKLRRSKAYKAEYLEFVEENTAERQKFWRNKMLEQQLAYERNEARVDIMSAEELEVMRKAQVELQLAQMDGRMAPLSQEQIDQRLEGELSEEQRTQLAAAVQQFTTEVEAKFLPRSEILAPEVKALQGLMNQANSESDLSNKTAEEAKAAALAEARRLEAVVAELKKQAQ